jgi:hypothetical protein
MTEHVLVVYCISFVKQRTTPHLIPRHFLHYQHTLLKSDSWSPPASVAGFLVLWTFLGYDTLRMTSWAATKSFDYCTIRVLPVSLRAYFERAFLAREADVSFAHICLILRVQSLELQLCSSHDTGWISWSERSCAATFDACCISWRRGLLMSFASRARHLKRACR